MATNEFWHEGIVRLLGWRDVSWKFALTCIAFLVLWSVLCFIYVAAVRILAK
jgi:hypothetical protein